MEEGELAARKLKIILVERICSAGLEETFRTRAERINECEKGRCGSELSQTGKLGNKWTIGKFEPKDGREGGKIIRETFGRKQGGRMNRMGGNDRELCELRGRMSSFSQGFDRLTRGAFLGEMRKRGMAIRKSTGERV
jgi:hypothetical protein